MGILTYSIDNMDVPELERTLNLYKNNTVKYYIGIGYILKQLKKKAEYDDWDTFCRERYGMDKTQASRCMNANTRYSKERYGFGMELDDKYEGLNKSVLVEMLSLPPELEEKVTPDMRATDVREMAKQYKQEQKEQQMHTDDILEQPEQVTRTYDDGDEIEGADLELICHLVKCYVDEANLCWDDLTLFDYGCISGDYEYDGKEYSMYSDDESDEYPISDKPGYIEIFKGYTDDHKEGQQADIYLQHAVWMRLMKKLLADRRKMCCYEDVSCQYVGNSKRKHNITGNACPEKCCMVCPELSGCSWACMSAMKRNLRDQLEDLEDVVDTELEEDFEEDSMELYPEVEEESEEVALTVPIELPEEEVIDAEYKEITEDDAISQQMCDYRCIIAAEAEQELYTVKNVISEETDDMKFIREYHREQSDLLQQYIEVGDLPDKLMKRQKILVGALASMIFELESIQEAEPVEQPEFPTLKNQEQRKEFLESFHTWPIWYQVQQASEIYYRYDLPDGSSIVVCEYRAYVEWNKHRGRDPEVLYQWYYLLKPGYHYLNDCKTSVSQLVEHLKEVKKTVETP